MTARPCGRNSANTRNLRPETPTPGNLAPAVQNSPVFATALGRLPGSRSSPADLDGECAGHLGFAHRSLTFRDFVRRVASRSATRSFRRERLGTSCARPVNSNTDHTMAKLMEYRGLCSTCANARACALRRTRREPAIFCELFETEAARPRRARRRRRTRARTATLEETGLIGLCADCLARAVCSFSKADGGVWHCEEYR